MLASPLVILIPLLLPLPLSSNSQVTTASRTTVSAKYFQQMYNAKIIVTVNPSSWEGDFRLWEALGSGALVFVDYLFVPHMYPLISEEHVVLFDNNNATDLFTKLDYYRSHWEEGRRIAHSGYLHALKHHRTVNMIDYVLTTAHTKRLTITGHGTQLPGYLYIGQYLHQETVIQERMIKKCKRPGIYETGSLDSEEEVKRLRC
ncbi:glycosyltransferase family 1 protein [archaeon]|nr:MAG: glycosyltransferase family 1 protein [archaeon]